MSCVPSRRRKCPPSVDVGCGYKATVSGNSVTIRPTVLNSECDKITVGLGDATFTFNPKKPPKTITRIITKDASGSYAPPVLSEGTRHTKSFNEVVMKDESFTDADGNVTKLQYPELKGYKEDYVAGNYSASGIFNPEKTLGRVMW